MELQLYLDAYLAEGRKRLTFVQQELKTCCPGRLSEETKNGHAHFIQTIYQNGKRTRRGLNKRPEQLQSLIKKQVLEAEQKYLLDEQALLSQYKDKLGFFDINDQINKLKKACPDLDDALILSALNLTSASEWEREPYEQSDYKPEAKRQITTRGLCVRSKSELLIAEKLYMHKIPFRYEQVMHFDTITLIPDFTIRRSDGKIFLWEHEGLTNIQKYLDWQSHKGKLYASKGFVPWDNLIVTYDSADGLIDLRIIESEIQNKLL